MRNLLRNNRQITPRGFTLLEALIVVAMMAMIATFSAPIFTTNLFAADVSSSADLAVDALREAQSGAMSGRNPGKFGVHFEAGQFVFFRGAAYDPGNSDNNVHDLSDGVTISSVSLTPATSDVIFANHRGIPSQYGTVTFLSSDGTTRVVTVGEAGMIDSQ